MPTAAIVSFRLGVTDGVSTVAESWRRALATLGFETFTLAGEGPVDRLVPGLAIGALDPPSSTELDQALAGAELVVVENLLTIPLNLPASRVTAEVLRGRRALLHHHDPPWQRERFRHIGELPPVDPSWLHVTINELTRGEMSERGIEATTIYNGFEFDPAPGDRELARARLRVAPGEWLAVHPVRAIERKGVPEALRLCQEIGATYWLTGPAEEGYGPRLASLLDSTSCRVIHRTGFAPAEIYAAADLVLYPSTWEGFGNPPVEAAARLRPAAVGRYPVAEELRRRGVGGFDADDPAAVAGFLASPDTGLLDQNREVVRRHLSLELMTRRLGELLDSAGWLP